MPAYLVVAHRTLVEGHASIVADNLDVARTILNEAKFLPDQERLAIVAMRDRYEAGVRTVIEGGIESWKAASGEVTAK
jgi:hypothetical protein